MVRTLDRARKAVDALVKAKSTSRPEKIATLDKAISPVQALELEQTLSVLTSEQSGLVEELEETLKHR